MANGTPSPDRATARLQHRGLEYSYTNVPNAIIRDRRMSWKSLGLLTFLLQLPPGWRIRLGWLSKQKTTGRDGTRAAMSELEDLGYMGFEYARDEQGRYTDVIWWVTNDPASPPIQSEIEDENLPDSGFSGIGQAGSGKPKSDKPTLVTTTEQQSLTKTTTTRPKLDPTKQSGSAVVVDLSEDLVMPPQFTSVVRASACRILVRERCPQNLQQDVLDEVQRSVELGEIKKTPLSLLTSLARAAASGMFVLDRGIEVKERRQREAEKATSRSVQPENILRRTPGFAEASIAAICQDLRGGRS